MRAALSFRSWWGGACLLAGVAVASYFFVDKVIAYALFPYVLAFPWIKTVASYLVDPVWCVILTLCLWCGGVALGKGRWRSAWLLLCTTQVVGAGCVQVAKCLLGRARPHLLIEQGLYGFCGGHAERAFHSFPSGHGMAAMALGWCAATLYPRQRFPIMTWASCAALGRVLASCHFLSDVVATTLVALLLTKGVCYFLSPHPLEGDWESTPLS